MNLTGRPIVNAISETGLVDRLACPCGCGVESFSLNAKGHARGCKCRSCIGRRNRRKGMQQQREAFKQAGGTAAWRGQMANEERWNSFEWAPGLRWEMKSGKQVPAWVTSAIAQVQAAHDMGLYRPGLMIRAEGATDVWCLVKLDDLKNQCLALSEVGRGDKIRSLVRKAKHILEEVESAAV